ncbi:beta strand repeat-containing protein, partial [Candidatus Nitrosarchaeum limnium]
MNNEIGRKITSLTLMTIMLAGSMTIVAPSMMPAAHAANANLFVSAENSQFNNYMSGPQVVEVVVIDSSINDTNEGKGEPDVKVNGKKLRMAQAVDGNWYGYFADNTQARTADQTTITAPGGFGLDFGQFCSQASLALHSSNNLGMFTDTVGVAIPVRSTGSSFGTNGTATATACDTSFNGATAIKANSTHTGTTAASGVEGRVMNVVREAKTINTNSATGNGVGQIGLKDDGLWPFIQLYSLSVGGNVIVSYNKGGGVQSTTLTFDTVDQFANTSLDKVKYTQKSQIHTTITDLWLNIDPTDEDSWTFGTNATALGANEAARTTLSTNYQVFNENGQNAGASVANGIINIKPSLSSLMVETNGVLIVNANPQGAANAVLTIQDNDDTVVNSCSQDAKTCTVTNGGTILGRNSQPITITEQGPNSGIFGTYDESDTSVIKVTDNAARGTSATINYNEVPRTVLVGFDFATISISPSDTEWNSGEEIPITLVDGDANKNSRADEDLDVFDPNVTLIPALITGDPFTIGENGTGLTNAQRGVWVNFTGTTSTGIISSLHGSPNATATINVQKFSERAIVSNSTSIEPRYTNALVVELGTTIGDLRQTIRNPIGGTFHGFNFLNLDLRSFNTTSTFDVYLLNSTTANGRIITSAGVTNTGVGALLIADNVSPQSLTILNATASNARIFATGTAASNHVGLLFVNNGGNLVLPSTSDAIVADFFSYGFLNDGLKQNERIANQIIRFELEETGDNTSTFAGTVEYIMLNQLNILDASTYANLSPIADDPTFIVIEDLDNEDSPRVNYNDLGADGVTTQVSAQQAAPAHSGIVSFNSHNFKTADTVTVTVQDVDLNVDSDLIDIYTVVSNLGRLKDVVGNNSTSVRLSNNDDLGRLLDITFDDSKWTSPAANSACATSLSNAGVTDTGLGATGFTLVETGPATGTFVGDFQIPSLWCAPSATTATTVTGLDIEVNYVDFRDASGETIEVGDSAGVRANTGSVSLDRTVYPVPFGIPSNFATTTVTTPSGRSIFPIHQTGMDSTSGLQAGGGEFLADGDLTIHVRVNDPDFDVSASGEDKIGQNTTSATKPVGPVKVSVLRGSSVVVLGYAGGDAVLPGPIDVDDNNANATRQFGPMTEISPDAGIFEADIDIKYTDGPSSTICPATTAYGNIVGTTTTNRADRFDAAPTSG